MDSRGRLSLRSVPRLHFILHFAFCILHFALVQPRLSLRSVPRLHFILHFAFCILHWCSPACPYGLCLVCTSFCILHSAFCICASPASFAPLTNFPLSIFNFPLAKSRLFCTSNQLSTFHFQFSIYSPSFLYHRVGSFSKHKKHRQKWQRKDYA